MNDLENSLGEWVAAGLISADQAAAIRTHEGLAAPERRVPLIAEVLGYLGGSLAIIAAIILVQQFWADMETWARLLLVGAATVAFLAAGWFIRPVANAAVRRLSSFLWALGSVGVALWFGLFADDVFATREESTALIAAVATLVVALLLYRLATTALQQIVVAGATVAVALSALAHLERLPVEFYGLAVWGLGIAWLLLAWGRVLRPEPAADALGSLGALLGPQVMRFEEPAWPLLLGLVTAGALLGVSVALRQTVLLAFGAAGIFLFVPQIIFEFFGDTIGVPLALFLTGVVLLGGALLVARLRSEVTGPDDEEVAA